MKASQFLLATLKERPAEADVISHQLMLRAGLIRQLASGIYTWLPLGFRVLQKVMGIVREEMDKSGAIELSMPVVQPITLLKESGRLEGFGAELLRMQDRRQHDVYMAPTHEEAVTHIAAQTIRSYKQLPINLYHIQTKFRDEIRPRFGVMRAREFLMKDAYSFDMTSSGLDQSYEVMYATYQRIFNRLQLKYRAVLADTGTMGGSYSHEFQVLANTGEDIIVYSDTSDYAANLEKAESLPPEGDRPEPSASRVKVPVPSELDLSALARHLNMALAKLLKTFILKGQATPWIALVLRGDHSLNLIKVKELPEVLYPLEFASSEDMQNLLGCDPHAMGPVDLPFPYIVDREAAHAADFVCGGNQRGYCWKNVNWERDLGLGKIADIRDVLEGDRSPDGQGHLRFARGIEVGHIFKLNDRFSHKVDFSILDETGRPTYLQMGCYGIGISRIVAAAIEQHHDQHGIIWPSSIAPFCVGLIPIDLHRSVVVQRACAAIYAMLTDAGIEVFWDDRKERLGVLLADMDLIGIPHRLVIGERSLKCGTVEYKARRDKTGWALNMDNLLAELEEILSADLELT